MKKTYKLVIAVVVLLVLILTNSIYISNSIQNLASTSLKDSSGFYASSLEIVFSDYRNIIVNLADSIARMPEKISDEDYMARKATANDFNRLTFINTDNGIVSNYDYNADLVLWLDENRDVKYKPYGGIYDDGNLIFTSPVIKDGQYRGVVIGTKKFNSVMSGFKKHNKSITYAIVDKDSLETKFIIKSKTNTVSLNDINRIIRDIKNEKELDYTEFFVDYEDIIGTNYIYLAIGEKIDLIMWMLPYYILNILYVLMIGFVVYLLIDSTKKNQDSLEKVFLKDSLTGGYNRDGFLKTGHKLLVNNGYYNYALVYMDVMNFRSINNLWGERVGDSTLKYIYDSLNSNIGEKELVYRDGIDHFIILLHESTKANITSRINEMMKKINDHFEKRHQGYSLDFTIASSDIGEDLNLKKAINNASYIIKNRGAKNNIIFYDKNIVLEVSEKNELNAIFASSLRDNHFKIYFQPKVSNNCIEAEALVRWIHPEKGIIFPDRFINLFESNGKIAALDRYVFEKTCEIASKWLDSGINIHGISVNLSRFTVTSDEDGIWEDYAKIKDKYNIPDYFLEIEITETQMFTEEQIAYTNRVIKGFRENGFKVALDDFGHAYSSLGLLSNFDIDTIKLDRNFFIDSNDKTYSLVEGVIKLAHTLGVSVVAEGLDDLEQIKRVFDLGCDFVQGYGYSKPVDEDMFVKWLDNYEKDNKY